jgi:hypothetical protein
MVEEVLLNNRGQGHGGIVQRSLVDRGSRMLGPAPLRPPMILISSSREKLRSGTGVPAEAPACRAVARTWNIFRARERSGLQRADPTCISCQIDRAGGQL